MGGNLSIFSFRSIMMKKFLLKLSFIFLLIVLSDFIFGSIVDALYQKIPTKQSYALKRCKDDIIILGSSRAENGIIPSIITDSINMSCYNLAAGGQNIYYYFGILNTVLTHHTPKIVMIDLTVIDYNNTPTWNTEKLSALNPLYCHVDSVKRLINSVDFLNKYRLLSNTFKFNSTLFTLITANLVENSHKNDFINGFHPISKKYDNEIKRPDPYKFKIDNDKIGIIRKIQNICYEKSIKLVLLMSPQYLQLDNSDQNIVEFENIMTASGFDIWNYSQDTTLVNNNDLFADPAHLNKFGAEKYSQTLAQRLKEKFRQ